MPYTQGGSTSIEAKMLRSPAIVVAFLMKSKGWRLPQSYQWVKERRPSVDISQVWIEIKYNTVRSDINCKLFSEVEITK
ncbi:Protein-tyrosine-phosphatase IBR5 -like protein [Gossypium arboreum]|uniref:Protein-tyrosine-phosphatase IBR5-like protein n=1 Tax=Gossypium arboreum TaxID=29729 RepID=A0A0B0PVA8_GOSAR|nr:Protein-tyrosine-phosphatase IBR5 -like protein [Gossypium arboreum]